MKESINKGNEHIGLLKGSLALSPILVFLLLYVVVSVIIGDFYKMPLSIAFIVASAWALITTRGLNITDRINVFSQGAANSNIIYMIWIFILAGAFSGLARGIGAVDATVDLTLSFLPHWFVLPGLFLVTCFLSMSIGTSVGTIVALTPFACQLAETGGGDVAFYVSIVLGGSFFGDNLSFISDTTIAATRSQGVQMSDKFKTNLKIVLPAAIVVLIVYVLQGGSVPIDSSSFTGERWPLVLPYFVVILTAAVGINVLVVLVLGIISCIVLSLSMNVETLMTMCSHMGNGITGMSDLIVVTLLAAGLLNVISHNGGIKYIIQLLTTRMIKGSRGAQMCVSILVSLVNVCTANNTIAIITVGEIARKIGEKFNVQPRKMASLLDTSSCVVQCLLPYGAQSMLAASLAQVSPVSFLPYLYYCWALAIMVILSILVKKRNY